MNRQVLTFAAFLLASAPLLAQQDDIETRAMKDEMQRSLKELHLESMDRPYYVAYKIVDSDRKQAVASLGALLIGAESHLRILTVTVRVGSYDFDSGAGSTGEAELLPIDDNYDELRRKLWLATDGAYKKAVEDLSAKKAAQQNRNRDEALADFSKEPARQESESLPPIDEKLADIEHLVRDASAVFRKVPMMEGGEAEVEVENSTERFLNSEGTAYVRQVPYLFFHAAASLQNPSGEIFSDAYYAYGRSQSDLPSEDAIVKGTAAVADRLSAELNGKPAEQYSGPVLVQGESAAELFAHSFANQLSARTRPTQGGGGRGDFAGPNNGSAASLLNKVGSRVLPDFLTVVDNPQLTQADGQPLLGNYKFDEEGVPTRETVLVKDGYLKTLLNGRTPVHGVLASTGNVRQRGVLPGNLVVDASKSSSRDDLKKQLVDLVKARSLQYGMIVRRLSGATALEAVRVYPDGHEEVVRDSRVAEVTLNSFKDILAVSKERTVYTERGQAASLAGVSPYAGIDLVTYVVPDMLFEDMTVERVQNNSPKPTAIPSPLASN
jgi:predicted Zn-dependent protease